MKHIVIIALIMCTMCLCGCTNYRILAEIKAIRSEMATKAQVSKLDSLYNFNQLKLYEYEKGRLDSTYSNISDDELLRRVRSIIKKDKH